MSGARAHYSRERASFCRSALYSCCVLRWLLPLFLVVSAHAQPYPDKPLRRVVGFSAGGPTDLPARFLGKLLADT